MTEVDTKAWTASVEGYVDSIGRLTTDIVDVLIPRALAYHPISADSYVLDDAAGTGTVTAALRRLHPETRVLATDSSPAMLEKLETRMGPGKYTTQVVDALRLTEHLGTSLFSHVICTFSLDFMEPPVDAVKQMHAVLKPDGAALVATWGYTSHPLIIFQKAAKAADPHYRPIEPTGNKTFIRNHDDLAAIMSAGGFKDVVSGTQDFNFKMPNAAAFIDYFFRAGNPVNLRLISSVAVPAEELEKAMYRIVYEEYSDGRGVCFNANYAMGRK